jgi:hypothetical protein
MMAFREQDVVQDGQRVKLLWGAPSIVRGKEQYQVTTALRTPTAPGYHNCDKPVCDDYQPAQINDARLLVTCHHESGHAVGALALGVPFTFTAAYGKPRDGLIGLTQVPHHCSPVRTRALLALCGPAAESIITGKHLSALFGNSCPSDWRLAMDMLQYDTTHGLSLAGLADEARELTARRWSSVSTLAPALVNRERLAYRVVLQVLGISAVAARADAPASPVTARLWVPLRDFPGEHPAVLMHGMDQPGEWGRVAAAECDTLIRHKNRS